MRLNRILLSFGTFTLLMIIGALFLVLTRLFDFGETGKENLYVAGFFMVFLTPFGFMGFIAFTEEYKRITNLTIVRILLVLSIIPIVVILVFGRSSPFFGPSIGFTAINAIFVIQIQVKIIRKTIGKMKARFTQVFVGEMLALSSLAFALMVAFTGIVAFFFIAITMLITGFLIMFYAANDFPPFYEFDWMFSLISALVISEDTHQILYAKDFAGDLDAKGSKDRKDRADGKVDRAKARQDLFSGAITGIDDMIASITTDAGTAGEAGPKRKLSRIEKEGTFIFIEREDTPGTSLLFVLLAKKDLTALPAFLKRIKDQFTGYFRDLINNLDALLAGRTAEEKVRQLFESFDIILENMVHG